MELQYELLRGALNADELKTHVHRDVDVHDFIRWLIAKNSSDAILNNFSKSQDAITVFFMWTIALNSGLANVAIFAKNRFENLALTEVNFEDIIFEIRDCYLLEEKKVAYQILFEQFSNRLDLRKLLTESIATFSEFSEVEYLLSDESFLVRHGIDSTFVLKLVSILASPESYYSDDERVKTLTTFFNLPAVKKIL